MQMQPGQHAKLAGMPPPYKRPTFVRRSWHQSDDISLRREISTQIAKLIYGSIPQSNISGVVSDLEKTLYLCASSKEEYADLGTLEYRVCLVFGARNPQKSAQHAIQESPVFKSCAVAPNPTGGLVFPAVGNMPSLPLGMRGGSCMIPTPGLPLPSDHGVGNNVQSGGIPFGSGVGGHGHAVHNGTSLFHGSPNQLNTRQGGEVAYSFPKASQHLYGFNGYMNGFDNVDGGNLYNTVAQVGPNLDSSSLDVQASSKLTSYCVDDFESCVISQSADCTLSSPLLQQQQQQPGGLVTSSDRILLDSGASVMFISRPLEKVNSQSEQSEHAQEANSTDTGQSEVVSNGDSSVPTQRKEGVSSIQYEEVQKLRFALALFWHVSRCRNSGTCNIAYCKVGRDTWEHLKSCRTYPCSQLKCLQMKRLLNHHRECRTSRCAVCGPVRIALRKQEVKMNDNRHFKMPACREVESPHSKRAKTEILASDVSQTSQQTQQSVSTMESTSCVDRLTPKERLLLTTETSEKRHQNGVCEITSHERGSSCESEQPGGLKELLMINAASLDEVQVKPELTDENKGSLVGTMVVKPALATEKPTKAKLSGISYIESLTPQQIRQHISSLRKWFGQSKSKAERNQAMEQQMSPSACSACAVEVLRFDPIPVFCTQCGNRIKRNAMYHSSGSGENGINFCGVCYSNIRTEIFESDGIKIQKSMLSKKKNDEQRAEAWVQCDKCKEWQHQICVLFNARVNKERSEYICPECCMYEMELGTRVPRSTNAVPGAKDLPRTLLSDHIEKRLERRLKQERRERAMGLGKPVEEVPTAADLVVRVISSVYKKLEVRPKFLELFQHEDYPKEYTYKSKMLMLFQKIEGVEVCLFGMYVQEFGSECPQPNHRHVYLSYLDSVKYFRPDVKTINGEALRTFVYHEILIAYLDYCKRRGFSSCYIWACPPLKGDDYILYCHPEIQKTPKTDKLREWYLSMVAKAKKEGIVVANKNMYDYFFTMNGESKAKVTATRLPYFDGDYWPGAAEDILLQPHHGEEGSGSLRRGRVAAKRTTKTSAHAELAGNTSPDQQLMQKLGQTIVAMKEDFMMIHLHHSCSYCHNFILCGCRWLCQKCNDNFQLCSGCYEEHQKLTEEERHPMGKKEWHTLVMEEVESALASTTDEDEIMESELFDNRHAFLNLCQGNQYQYDTLRRAKHSSMMVLYHLHNPDAPAFVASCSLCHEEIEGAQGWKCQICVDFEVCKSCHLSEGAKEHPHKLVARTTAWEDSAKERLEQLKMMLNVLVHASKCLESTCQFEKCRNMKDLFRHGFSCAKRVSGGCSFCQRMWILLQCHARSCKENSCSVPRCMDLRKHFRRLQLQQESRRRAAVQEMMRQRAAEQNCEGQVT